MFTPSLLPWTCLIVDACRAASRRAALIAVVLVAAPLSLSFQQIPCASAATATFEARTVSSTDDAEEFADHTMYIKSSDLELTEDSSNQTIGMRWTGLTIPQGAFISAAYIQFSSKESHSNTTNLVFKAQRADNAATFTSAAGDISSRLLGGAAVSWAPAAWVSGATGPDQRTPDLKDLIQEVVSRSGWASGNALAIVMTGSGHRTAWAWDGDATQSPLLHVEYTTTAPVDLPPVAALTVSQLASPALTVSASGAGSTDTDATPIASYQFTFGDGS